jgi:hypothetical protein
MNYKKIRIEYFGKYYARLALFVYKYDNFYYYFVAENGSDRMYEVEWAHPELNAYTVSSVDIMQR